MKVSKVIPSIKSKITTGLFMLFGFMVVMTQAQELVINEVMSSNSITLSDEDGDSPDWIELFNVGSAAVNLDGYGISDSSNLDQLWLFPEMEIKPGEYVLVFASDKDRRDVPLKWETIIDLGDEWSYIVPEEDMPSEWNSPTFDDSSWSTGASGFGYGDNDDNTVLNASTLSVFIRKEFTINDPSDVREILLHMDYDDAFVAYINGIEVARANITSQGSPAFDQPADNFDHEANMYGGGQPDLFVLSGIEGFLVAGLNILAIQVHNHSTGSSDLTAIPFLSLGTVAAGEGGFSPHLISGAKNLHTNFKLSSEGEHLILLNPSGDLVDSVFIPELPANVSLGRDPDGVGEWQYFGEATPAAANSTSAFSSIAGEVTFSQTGGMYNSALQLELGSGHSDDKIYYTTDGSSPGVSGILYTGAIEIKSTTIIRAQVVNNNSVPGPIGTQTYFLNSNHKLAVVSIATDPENLWDYNDGIYVMGPNAEGNIPHFGANFWQDWEKPIHIEMYEPNGDLAFAQNAGTKIFGGWSRAHAQKSLSIFARKSYGKDDIDYKIFPDSDMDEFSSLVLRNSGNDWNNTMFRDALLTSLFHETVDKQAYRPAVLYINGEYWGIQNIREKMNEDYLASHHNLDPDSITILQSNAEPVEGDEAAYLELLDFIRGNNLADDQNYEYVKEQVDIFNFIQYQIGNIYVDNKDWPGNNIKYWRANRPGAKWRWIAYDTDFGFDIYNQGYVSYNTLRFAMDPNGPGWPNPPWSTLLFRKLLANEQFKNEFINIFADRLNSAFLPGEVNKKIDVLKAGIEPEIRRHLNRWGGNTNNWEENISRMRSFATERPAMVRQHIRSVFGLSSSHELTLQVNNEAFGAIKINSLKPVAYPWSGIYFQRVPVELTAVPQPGYRFLRWEGDIGHTDSSIAISLTKATTVKAVFELADSKLNSVVINEINYNSSDDFDTKDWVELYNKGGESIDMSGWALKDDNDSHEFVFAEGTILESGEFLIICNDQEAFSLLVQGVPYAGNMDFGLSGDGDCVRLFNEDDVLTDEVCYQSISPWPTSPNGEGATLALKHPTLNNANPQNWYALGGNGNPGESNDIALNLVPANEYPGLDLKIFPNPVQNGIATITYHLKDGDRISLKMYDMEGKLMRTLHEGNKSRGPGMHHVELAPALLPGVYLIILEGNNGKSTARFIIE